jgi:lipopolysaccharide biosynthesis glycosyltransferase
MQVGFLYVGPASPIAEIMVASVKKAMPQARIIQMSDSETLKVRGVDQVIRKPQTDDFLMCYRLLHLRDFPPGDTLFLDADVVVQRDVSDLFSGDFDIALTFRDQTDRSLRYSPDVREEMPFNTGVMLAKASGWQFWADAHAYSLTLDAGKKRWYGDQLAIRHVADHSTLNICQFPCALYNYSPWHIDEDISEKHIVHYKGDNRKLWMLEAAGLIKLPGRGA